MASTNDTGLTDINPDYFNLSAVTFGRAITVETGSHYIKPPLVVDIPAERLRYDNAKQLALDMVLTPGFRHYAYVNGSFYFGDFIEALFVERELHTKRLTLSTLSMNENNVDSLAALLNEGYVDSLDLVVSDFFFSHERHGLIPYLYSELDKAGRFQLAVAGSHCKLAVFTTDCGLNIGLRGSANMRSSGCTEHFFVEDNAQLNAIDEEAQTAIINHYRTINKPLRHATLWQTMGGSTTV